jgi:hypothetical protein
MAARVTHHSLEALSKSASTGRLLNLSWIATKCASDPEWSARPFFKTPIINTCLVVKHTPRAHEMQIFDRPPHIATKVIFPFDRENLALGGRSVFVGQKGWMDQLQILGHYAKTVDHDSKVLTALDELPSLDPFLVREHLARRGFHVGACYLAISDRDVERMKKMVAQEVGQLIGLAFDGTKNNEHTAKLVQLLLTNEADARLEPLRLTLKLEGDAYKEGIFSWRGFLYYKWSVDELRMGLLRVLRDLGELKPKTKADLATNAEIARGKTRLVKRIKASEAAALEALRTYDGAFWALVKEGNPSAFRDFLLRSPRMFVGLGAAVGGLSHIVSYWGYRFADGAPITASEEEVLEILHEFESSLAGPMADQHAA